MRLILAILISMSFKSFGFSFQSSKGMENFIQKSNAVPCVQAYLKNRGCFFREFRQFAVIRKLKVPAAVGVPLTVPSEVLSDNPFGTSPLVTEYEYVPAGEAATD